MASSQPRHLKCIIGAMKALIVILLMAVAAQAQTLADAARRERARQAGLKPHRVITTESLRSAAGSGAASTSSGTAAPAPPAANRPPVAETPKEPPKPAPPKIDPVKEWNDQLDKLRTKIRELQDQETAIQLQINQLNNQVFAPVIDQATKDQAMAQVGQTQQKLASVREELDQTKKTLDAKQLQGPATTK